MCRYLSSWVLLAFFVLALVIPSVTFGEESEDSTEVQTLDPIVVSATKTPIPLSHVTSAVEVITEKDLQKRKAKTVIDALRLSQGTAVFSNGGPGTIANVRIRGGTSRQTLVLIDGAIVNSATLGEFNFAHLTTDNVEQVEIVRGAQSTVWGADAMAGVINITTKKGSGPFRANGFFEYGSFNTIREGGQLLGKTGPFDVAVSLSRWDSTGFSAINYRLGASERDAYRNWQASTRVGVDLPREGRIDFNFRWWNGNTNIDSAFGPSDVIKARNDSNQLIFSGIYVQPFSDWYTHRLTVSRAQEASLFLPGISQRNLSTGAVSVPFGSANETRVLSNRIETQHNFRIGELGVLTMGYQFREQQGENDTSLTTKITSSHAGFVMAQGNLFERLFWTAGVRHDSFNTFGDATTYRVTGGYLLKGTGTKIRASYATGFRAPTINELFFPDFGNPNLQPEKSKSLDVGVDQFLFNKVVKVSGGYFWNRFRDLIETIQSAATCGVGAFGANFCPVNVSSAKTQGWELAAAISIVRNLPFFKRLDITGQYTYTITRNLNTNARLARWPVDQASISILYQPIEPLTVIADYRFVGSQFDQPSTAEDDTEKVNSFNVINIIVTYDVNENVQIYTRVDNLFDEEYEEIQNFGTAVRSIYGGMRVNFDIPVLSN